MITPDDPGEAFTEGKVLPFIPREPTGTTIRSGLLKMCERGVLTDFSSGEPVVVTTEQFQARWPDSIAE